MDSQAVGTAHSGTLSPLKTSPGMVWILAQLCVLSARSGAAQASEALQPSAPSA